MIRPFSKLTAEFFQSGKQTIPEMWALNGQKDQIIYKMMKEWESHGFDAMISCAFPMPAVSPDHCSRLISGVDSLTILDIKQLLPSFEFYCCLQPGGMPCRDPSSDNGECPGSGSSC